MPKPPPEPIDPEHIRDCPSCDDTIYTPRIKTPHETTPCPTCGGPMISEFTKWEAPQPTPEELETGVIGALGVFAEARSREKREQKRKRINDIVAQAMKRAADSSKGS